MQIKQRYLGSLIGLACGDALGVPNEFQAPGTFKPVTDIIGGGVFKLEPGYWTDDTSMALCLAESLVHKKEFDPVDQLERYVDWWRNGHLSSTGECFDIGISTSKALAYFEQNPQPFPGLKFPESGGNGALMRLAPIPLAYAKNPWQAIRRAGHSSEVTHGAPESFQACCFYSGLIVGALNGVDKSKLLVKDTPYHPVADWPLDSFNPKIRQVITGSYLEKEPPDITGNGYVVDTLEAALWAFARTDNFEDGALEVVNLGDDADTTGAVYGQLAGAYYGIDSIPQNWLDKLIMLDTLENYALNLLELSQKIKD
jgi:ADP-ribosylglycohydrolase